MSTGNKNSKMEKAEWEGARGIAKPSQVPLGVLAIIGGENELPRQTSSGRNARRAEVPMASCL